MREAQISFTGDSGIDYVLEAGPDLIHWLPMATNTIWTGPIMGTEAASSRFYRLRRQ